MTDPDILLAELREAKAELARFRGEHARACETIAAMHTAAHGEIRGPVRGVVEDIEDLRIAFEAVQKLCAFWKQAADQAVRGWERAEAELAGD